MTVVLLIALELYLICGRVQIEKTHSRLWLIQIEHSLQHGR
jgi:hypothetical protein